MVPPIQDQPRPRALSNEPGKDVKGRCVCLGERREHELACIQAKTVLGKDGIEGVTERNELRLDAVKLWYAAQSGESVGQQSLAQFLLSVTRGDKESTDQPLVFFQHVERVSDRLAVLNDGRARERPGIHEFLDQVNRGAIIPEQLSPPLLRLFGQQRIELPGSQLSQVHYLHGVQSRRVWASYQPFYHNAGCLVHFGNTRFIELPWRASVCANIRKPSIAQSAPNYLDRPGGAALHGQESERMGFISEFRYPTKWYSKLVIAALALFFFTILASAAISGYLVYRMISPAQSHSDFNLKNFPGHPDVLPYTVAGEGPRDGWFFPGLKSAPTVILCPAYQSSRGELLTLASTLQDHQYNVFLFDFSAHGSSGGRTTLGFGEVAELRAAMDAVANRGDVDPNRFGLWGVNLGAYVALSEATGDRRVRAIAVESPYDRPEEMVRLLVNRSGLASMPLVAPMARWGFGWVNYQYRNVPPLRVSLGKLTGVAQLYLESPDDPVLGANTTDLFRASPPPHELAVLPHGNYGGMLDEEKHSYENRIVSFFLVYLPPAGELSP